MRKKRKKRIKKEIHIYKNLEYRFCDIPIKKYIKILREYVKILKCIYI